MSDDKVNAVTNDAAHKALESKAADDWEFVTSRSMPAPEFKAAAPWLVYNLDFSAESPVALWAAQVHAAHIAMTTGVKLPTEAHVTMEARPYWPASVECLSEVNGPMMRAAFGPDFKMWAGVHPGTLAKPVEVKLPGSLQSVADRNAQLASLDLSNTRFCDGSWSLDRLTSRTNMFARSRPHSLVVNFSNGNKGGIAEAVKNKVLPDQYKATEKGIEDKERNLREAQNGNYYADNLCGGVTANALYVSAPREFDKLIADESNAKEVEGIVYAPFIKKLPPKLIKLLEVECEYLKFNQLGKADTYIEEQRKAGKDVTALENAVKDVVERNDLKAAETLRDAHGKFFDYCKRAVGFGRSSICLPMGGLESMLETIDEFLATATRGALEVAKGQYMQMGTAGTSQREGVRGGRAIFQYVCRRMDELIELWNKYNTAAKKAEGTRTPSVGPLSG